MRILISAGPMFGHVNTVLPLALAGQRAGHEVALATGPAMISHVERYGVQAWPVGSPGPSPRGAATPWLDYFIESATERAIDLVPRAAQWSPDLVVHEETELAGAVAARAAGAREIVHGLGLMPPIRIWEALEPGVSRLFQQWSPGSDARGVRDATYLDLCPPSLQPEGEAVWHRVQPLRPSLGQPRKEDQLPAALDDLPYARTVHLTLGTVFHDAVDVLRAAIAGLRELPVNLVVTTGPDSAPESFGAQPANVIIEPYLSHAQLLPRCDLVVSQGGAGIMFGALALGLPQVMLPQGADQDMNAEACARAGAALSLERDVVSAESVAAAAERLLEEPTFTEAAKAIRAEIEAMPDHGSVLAALAAQPRVSAG